jgi:hypothetical protein
MHAQTSADAVTLWSAHPLLHWSLVCGTASDSRNRVRPDCEQTGAGPRPFPCGAKRTNSMRLRGAIIASSTRS